MKSYDIIGYGYEGNLYCPTCLASEYEESANPIFAGNNEADTQMTCCGCNEEIDTSIISKQGMLMRIANKLIDEFGEVKEASIEIGNTTIEMGYKGFDTLFKYDVIEPIDGDWNYVFHDSNEIYGEDLANFSVVYAILENILKNKSLEDIYID